jgi:tetraacyldisaccharide 4'-kinase
MAATRSILLYPFSVLYGIITGVRNYLYNSGILHSVSFPVPVICVGNLTVGGTGKTPHTEYLVELLKKDFKVATLSRGYKRATSDFRIATPSSTPLEIGDEPLQIARKYPEMIVAVDRNRAEGIGRIMEEAPDTEVIILDDGFQHRKVKPGLALLLSDFGRPFYKDHMLPYGNLREYRSNARRADLMLITKCPKNLNPVQKRLVLKETDKAPYQKLFFTSIAYKAPVPVFGSIDKDIRYFDLTRCSGSGIVLLTGIANPGPLKEYLQKFFGEIVDLAFPDHHSFTEHDINFLEEAFNSIRSASRFIMTTEKDAVRLREMAEIPESLRSAMYYVPVGINFLFDEKRKFDELIIDYVRKNRKNSRIS